MLRSLILVLALGLGALWPASAQAQAQQQRMLDRALNGAVHTFEQAMGTLEAAAIGVDIPAYSDALKRHRFYSSRWDMELDVNFAIRSAEDQRCERFAAYVMPAIDSGAVNVMLCPKFFSAGADALRETTILHEMVHVVAGTDECQAMAFTAQVQFIASGRFQAVAHYWDKNRCARSAFSLPH
ncbi:hypothetical protein VW29_18075 [Devosia limi DSM 17137]|uniref:Lysine-specific metallo-endopeptidase domain-containing protein n=1 Tax=Devosia limi DSM 17137 TaxID=1121477 RepID=A0A0F5L6N3_9HYPH|nr:hypothetical protein [Devosia limi]KKB77282.1 hypothetical protein VW29_18075 [Devosia limi DSM 17137]SHE64560.1 hypothetical protein SAMN02745223_00772 [Devosia limi DSM 17137]